MWSNTTINLFLTTTTKFFPNRTKINDQTRSKTTITTKRNRWVKNNNQPQWWLLQQECYFCWESQLASSVGMWLLLESSAGMWLLQEFYNFFKTTINLNDQQTSWRGAIPASLYVMPLCDTTTTKLITNKKTNPIDGSDKLLEF